MSRSDFANAMQLHDFNDLVTFPARLKSLTICLSEVIFLEGFLKKIYTFISSLEVLHLIGLLMIPNSVRVTLSYISFQARMRKLRTKRRRSSK